MKKRKEEKSSFPVIVLAIFMVLFVSLTSSFNLGEIQHQSRPAETISEQSAVFPASLTIISDEAFAGTAIETAVFNDKLETIGNDVFSDANSLKDVYIPLSTVKIGDNAFPNHTVIHGAAGSYAQEWAEANQIQFVDDWDPNPKAAAEQVQPDDLFILFYLLIPVDIGEKRRIQRRILQFVRSMRPQDRVELYPINYRFP